MGRQRRGDCKQTLSNCSKIEDVVPDVDFFPYYVQASSKTPIFSFGIVKCLPATDVDLCAILEVKYLNVRKYYTLIVHWSGIVDFPHSYYFVRLFNGVIM